jgi:predicted esterase
MTQTMVCSSGPGSRMCAWLIAVGICVCDVACSHPNASLPNAQTGAAAVSGMTAAGSTPSAGVQATAGIAVAAAGAGGMRAPGAAGSGGTCVGSGCDDSLSDAGPDRATDAGAAGMPAQADAGSALSPDPKYFVPATGPCPDFKNGYVMFTPDGVARRVLLYISDTKTTLHGPLLFSWHSTLPRPEDATSWIGNDVIEAIKAQGGLVAAPTTGTPNTTRPWDNTPMGATGTDNDQRLMDEIVACAIQKVGIDVRRIHAIGMSAGGLKTATVSLRRSGYLASVVVYSGGLVKGDVPPDQDPDNKFAAMILYGGPSDISPVDGINYTDASRNYLDMLKAQGRFAFLCNHGGGHSVPQDSQASAWRFMQDHPFGTSPSPYAKQLPAGFLRYCTLSAP